MCDLKIVAVYGTLKEGGALHDPRGVVCSKEDKVKGQLHMVGGGNFRFPGIKLEGDELVDVEVQVVTRGYFDYMKAVEGTMYSMEEVITESGVPVIIFEFIGYINNRIAKFEV